MRYRLKVGIEEKGLKEAQTKEEALSIDILRALSDDVRVYSREGALISRIDYILGRATSLSPKSNSVTLRGVMYGEQKVPLRLPIPVQGGMGTKEIIEYTKREGQVFIPLQEFYDIRSYPGGWPEYMGRAYIELEMIGERSKREEMTESKLRQDKAIDRVFVEGPRDSRERGLVDHFYKQRKKLVGVEYTIESDKVRVKTQEVGFVNIERYKRVDKERIYALMGEVERKAEELGDPVKYQPDIRERQTVKWLEYELEYAESEEMFNEIKRGFEYLRDVRGIREGFREDYYLRDITETRLEYEKLGRRGSVLYEVQSVEERLERLLGSLEERARD